MSGHLYQLFEDLTAVDRIKNRLPYLFQLAEVESSRAGRVGMEVGNLRERVIVALLMWKFGEHNLDTEIPPTEAEVDVRVFGAPISIKTITGRSLRGVKLVWTVDAGKARQYGAAYCPSNDIILVQICWNATGGFYYLPSDAQRSAFGVLGSSRYIVLPKPNTNPRGVEISPEALKLVAADQRSRMIEVFWQRSELRYSPYRRWLDYWRED